MKFPSPRLLGELDEEEKVEAGREMQPVNRGVRINEGDSGNEGDTENTLTVEKPELPKELKKKRNKEQTKNGEMPSWATKFLQSNNIKASVDVGLNEAKNESTDETEKSATAEDQV